MSAESDRNLLVGILAIQMNFISRDDLIEAMNLWVLDKSRSIDEILLAQDALDQETRLLLDALISKHLVLHGGDSQKSLKSIGAIGSLKEDLVSVGDSDIEATMSVVAAIASSLSQQYVLDPVQTDRSYHLMWML